GAERSKAVGPLDLIHADAAMELQIVRLVTQRIDMRSAVLHHRQHAGRPRSRTVFFGFVAVAMTSMQCVEVTGLMGGMNRHPGKARLLEVEHTGSANRLNQRHSFTITSVQDTAR